MALEQIEPAKQHEDPAVNNILYRSWEKDVLRNHGLDAMTPQQRLRALCRAAERMGVMK